MAVLCPIYDPLDGWYIIDQSGNKRFISSLLYYYHSLGVSPPVGAKITQDDLDDFEAKLYSDDCSEDNDNYNDLGYLPATYPENFISKLSDLPPSVQFQPVFTGFPSLTEGVNQTSSTMLTVPYAPMTLPNYLASPAMPFIGQQPLSYTYPNQISPMTGSYNSYLSSMLPLPLSASKVTMNELMGKLDDQDEFEEEDSFNDCSSAKSSLISEMSLMDTTQLFIEKSL